MLGTQGNSEARSIECRWTRCTTGARARGSAQGASRATTGWSVLAASNARRCGAYAGAAAAVNRFNESLDKRDRRPHQARVTQPRLLIRRFYDIKEYFTHISVYEVFKAVDDAIAEIKSFQPDAKYF